MKVKVSIDDVDFAKIIIRFLPMLSDMLAKNEKTEVAGRILNRMGDYSNEAITAFFSALPQELQNEIAVMLVTEYKEQITASLSEGLRNNGIAMNIRDMEISNS